MHPSCVKTPAVDRFGTLTLQLAMQKQARAGIDMLVVNNVKLISQTLRCQGL